MVEDLVKAGACGKVDKISTLLNNGASVNGFSGACGYGREDAVRLLLFRGASVNLAKEGQKAPLLMAASNNEVAIVELLMQHGADHTIQSQSQLGYTALHYACAHETIIMVEVLLQHGANPDAADENGDTPLHIACAMNCPPMPELLLRHGANPCLRNLKDKTAFDFCADKGQRLQLEAMHEELVLCGLK